MEETTFAEGSNEVVGAGVQESGFTDTFTITFSGSPPHGASVTLSAIAVQSGNNTNAAKSGPVNWS